VVNIDQSRIRPSSIISLNLHDVHQAAPTSLYGEFRHGVGSGPVLVSGRLKFNQGASMMRHRLLAVNDDQNTDSVNARRPFDFGAERS